MVLLKEIQKFSYSQYCFRAGPASQTVVKRNNSIGLVYHFCWLIVFFFNLVSEEFMKDKKFK